MRVRFIRRETTDGGAAAFAPSAATDSDTGLYAGRARREAAEHANRAGAAIPPRLELDTIISAAPRRVILVTYDALARRLAVRSALLAH